MLCSWNWSFFRLFENLSLDFQSKNSGPSTLGDLLFVSQCPPSGFSLPSPGISDFLTWNLWVDFLTTFTPQAPSGRLLFVCCSEWGVSSISTPSFYIVSVSAPIFLFSTSSLFFVFVSASPGLMGEDPFCPETGCAFVSFAAVCPVHPQASPASLSPFPFDDAVLSPNWQFPAVSESLPLILNHQAGSCGAGDPHQTLGCTQEATSLGDPSGLCGLIRMPPAPPRRNKGRI